MPTTASAVTLDLFPDDDSADFSRPSYADVAPAWMLPETHPDYRPLPKVAHAKPRPKDKPFRWQTTCKPHTLAAHAARLKGLPPAATWTGSYLDAPASGQDGERWPAFETDKSGCYCRVPDECRGKVYVPRVWYDPAGGKQRASDFYRAHGLHERSAAA